jgi:hypothetical protein
MNVNDMKARVRRLEELARGLGSEVARWKADPGPLALAELRAYLAGIQDALAGVDVAVAASRGSRNGPKPSRSRIVTPVAGCSASFLKTVGGPFTFPSGKVKSRVPAGRQVDQE